jgi:hypothetical protein
MKGASLDCDPPSRNNAAVRDSLDCIQNIGFAWSVELSGGSRVSAASWELRLSFNNATGDEIFKMGAIHSGGKKNRQQRDMYIPDSSLQESEANASGAVTNQNCRGLAGREPVGVAEFVLGARLARARHAARAAGDYV